MRCCWCVTYVCEMRRPLVISARDELLSLGVAASFGTKTSSSTIYTNRGVCVCIGNPTVFQHFIFIFISVCSHIPLVVGTIGKSFSTSGARQRVHKKEETATSETVSAAKRHIVACTCKSLIKALSTCTFVLLK